ncbi:MAG TPA: asparagine synthase (glutamine-hydrolyzing) [Opitutaceae bacterium]|nr:asparagine synthase (glutamine-hydrolyzing) [Opitutaceae bacterium]
MCGIFGVLQARPILATELTKMSELLRHRGPNDEGFFIASADGCRIYGGADTPAAVLRSNLDYAPTSSIPSDWSAPKGGICFGHRRLSILDLSPAGHQPMSYRNRYWLIFNGEVFNYVEIREELKSSGYDFRTGTDSEVILAAYAQWGAKCLQRFNGMFAFAILDLTARKLFLARDRFGVKPLYYRAIDGQLTFASEIKAFAGSCSWKPKANTARLLDFLVWNISDHTDETFFAGVRQLPAGHFCELSVEEFLADTSTTRWKPSSISPQRWYELPYRPHSGGKESADEFKELLRDSIRLRLRSDVPVGSCLSGGLDSSSIVCLAAEKLRSISGGPLNTFTAGSRDAAYDETKYARSVIDAAGAKPSFVTPDPAVFLQDFDQIIWHQDEPFPTSSIFAQWCIFREARLHGTTVMLDGQGADESLGGYRGFFGAYLASLFRAGRLVDWTKEVRSLKREIGFSAVRSIGYTAAYGWPGMLRLLGSFENRSYSDPSWLSKREQSALQVDPIRKAGGRATGVRAMSLAQISATNLPMLLHWEDRNSMAFSIEARVPFLDYRLVEFCVNLPDQTKLSGGITKRVLREAMRGIVPDTVLNRRDKMGFVTAEPLWMKRDLTSAFRERLVHSAELLRGVVSNRVVEKFDTMTSGGRFDHRYFRVMAAGAWLERFAIQLT